MAGHERVLFGDLDKAARANRLPQAAEPLEVGRRRRLTQDGHAELDRGLQRPGATVRGTPITTKSGR